MSISHGWTTVQSNNPSYDVSATDMNTHVVPASLYAFPLDIPPVSAHAKDDEFSDATGQSGTNNGLDAKWTNPHSSGSGLTLTTGFSNEWFTFEPATAGSSSTGKHMFGIRQSAPTGSFTVSARVNAQMNYLGDDTTSGIWIARTASTLAHYHGFYAQNGGRSWRIIASASYSETADTGGYDGFVSDTGLVNLMNWYRIVWITGTSTIEFWTSSDGIDWQFVTSRTSMSQPDRIGIGTYSNTGATTANHKSFVKWFRVTEP